MSGPLILSVFPGIDSSQAEFGRRGHAPVNHSVVIRAQHPYVFGARVTSPDRNAVPGFLVVDVNNTVLPTSNALSWNVRIAPEEARDSRGPPTPHPKFLSLFVSGIASHEALPAAAACLLSARIGAVSLAPIPISREHGATDSTFAFFVGFLAVRPHVVFTRIAARLAGLRAESRVDLVRPIRLAAVIALAGRVLRQPRMSLAATALVDRHA
jgi:hypothetical protein